MYHLILILTWVFSAFLTLCLTLPGLAMLLAPDRVFRTAAKPRWVGLPVLGVGLGVLHFLWPLITDTSQLRIYFH